MWLFSHFMKESTSSSLSASLPFRKSNPSGLHDERLSCYIQSVNFLLATYATGDFIARAVKYLEGYKEAPDMAPAEWAEKLYTRALGCAFVYDEKRVKSLFAEGHEGDLCHHVQLYWSLNPSEPHTQLARYADTVTKIADGRITALGFTNRPN